MLSKEQVKKICAGIKNVRIGIIGDFCVDIYWHADMTKSELARDSALSPADSRREGLSRRGRKCCVESRGALPKELIPISLIGGDWRGMLMEDIFEKSGMNRDFVIKVPGRFTNAYCKPMRKGISELEYEDPRLDFDNYELISKETEDKVIENLRKISGNIDVLCVADQFRFGIITKRVRDEIITLAKSGLTVIADSRYNIGKYTDCILKPNEVECWRAVYNNEGYIDAGYDEFIEAAKLLAKKNRSTVFCTLGKRGSIVTDGDRTEKADAVLFDGEVDICGAGDTSLSAFSAAIAAKTELKAAAQFAGLASGVTVRKIGVTGTASPEETEALAQ